MIRTNPDFYGISHFLIVIEFNFVFKSTPIRFWGLFY